ncbi:hypothetical protein C8A00DRAFT_18846 [Chaetomidium leptoderma]|uniref:Uncharacterized protein n=1 Tax=Chaetomidium leptoderma TaxID=669021 RepID=A0AAN6ZRT3_9PEZI|nr:hypothetical protein C8A00DRAFT_18846 [Chaetomidium leptoderma]
MAAAPLARGSLGGESATEAAKTTDIAFNHRLIGYDVGAGRTPSQVIRVGNTEDEAISMEQAVETLGVLAQDQTSAGKEWSSAELAVLGSKKDDLVIIVGVLLPNNLANVYKPSVPKTVEEFDSSKHTLLSSNVTTPTVVRKLSGWPTNLFVLANKNPETDLCRVRPLPKKINRRIFFYREWTDTAGLASGQANARYDTWKRNIAAFADDYLDEHADDLYDEPIQPTGPQSGPVERTADMSMAFIMQSVALYSLTKNVGYLESAKAEGLAALGRTSGDEEQDDDMRHASDTISHLLHNREPFDIEEAKDAARACKKLWFNGPQDVIRYTFKPQHLLQLANGLRDGVLDDELIEHRLHQGIIINFCLVADDQDKFREQAPSVELMDTPQMIKEAYRRAILNCSNPGPMAPAPLPITDNPTEALCNYIKGNKKWIQAIIDHGDYVAMRYRQSVFGSSKIPRLPEMDMHTLIRNFAETCDIAEATRISEEMAFTALIWAENTSIRHYRHLLKDLMKVRDHQLADLEAGRFLEASRFGKED